MPLNLSVPAITELKPMISVIGVGGAGGNAVNNMIESNLSGVEFIAANTDAQAIGLSASPNKLQLGMNVTQGLGAGSQPEIGAAAAEESLDEVMTQIGESNMLFITAGMGGGTGTGAAPVIARAARERGILTVGVVTKPFHFEGARRMRLAEEGIKQLQQYVDTLLIIPNQNLFRLADDDTTFADAFAMADEVLHAGVRGITDLMIVPGLINLDFADVRSVMSEMGKAMMGTGEAEGERRAAEAADAAISNPLLDEVSMKGAKGVLINITGGLDMKLFEVDEAANRIRSEVDPDANIIVGSTFSDDLAGKMRVSVVATGIDSSIRQEQAAAGRPDQISLDTRLSKNESGYAASIVGLEDYALEGSPMALDLSVSDAPATDEPEAGALFADARPHSDRPHPDRSHSDRSHPGRSHADRPDPDCQPDMAAGHHMINAQDKNPVGDVQARIRKILTEEEPVASRAHAAPAPHALPDGAVKPADTARTDKAGSRTPLKSAMTRLKDSFVDAAGLSAAMPAMRADSRAQAAACREENDWSAGAAPVRKKQNPEDQMAPLFDEPKDDNLEIPAFLRRRNY